MIILWISNLIAKLFGFNDISLIQKRVILGLMLLALLVLGSLVFSLRGCFHKEPKLDEKQIQKIQTAIATQDREEMQKVLVESDVAEKKIDANVSDAHIQTYVATQDAKEKAAGLSNEQLAAELEKKLHE